MVYSSGPREGLTPRLHGRRKSPPYCTCDPVEIVPAIVGDVRKLQEFLSYYRQHIQD